MLQKEHEGTLLQLEAMQKQRDEAIATLARERRSFQQRLDEVQHIDERRGQAYSQCVMCCWCCLLRFCSLFWQLLRDSEELGKELLELSQRAQSGPSEEMRRANSRLQTQVDMLTRALADERVVGACRWSGFSGHALAHTSKMCCMRAAVGRAEGLGAAGPQRLVA